jgi:hypothetical protein
MKKLLLLLLLAGGVQSSVRIYKLNGDFIEMCKSSDLKIHDIQKNVGQNFIGIVLLSQLI